MKLVSTRAKGEEASFKEALLSPSTKDGGLFAPLVLPKFNGYELKDLSYENFALKLIQSFEFGEDEAIKRALKTYQCFDNEACPIELTKISQKLFINELYHGPTRAFKDMALQPFGVLLQEFAQGKNFLIMCATSGDTGPATLKSFENLEHIRVVCIYPSSGTSRVQALQMQSLNHNNLKVFAINGNFDDAQNTLKTLLLDKGFKEALKRLDIELSAANSVNFGRILFQIIYHYYACVKIGENVDIIVPSGNFGDALGAYYAKKMGAKIDKIKIASNENNILTDFFTKGEYDLRGRVLKKTLSPAMDILISSNIERLLFDKFKDTRTKELYEQLKTQKFFKLSPNELELLQEDFEADFCTDEQCLNFIDEFSKTMLIDPHTATCLKLLDRQKTAIITATAEWTKFTPSMYEALYHEKCLDEKAAIIDIAERFSAGVKMSILDLFDADIKQDKIYEAKSLKNEILEWIKQ
ncbi:threonine synthase [Campylobacter sp. MIT 99-7217]|uniref:threonine synthase n=1 Tax=Campylobacter sp. MIT 99-7217 TaxID=535091 RepID=UPI001157A653|nr:threonine synthase [Campylobacter sp. MIT 99-7217]TQR34645.1 threonine synthase [Campylobacter sp. MIT 99-7217]